MREIEPELEDAKIAVAVVTFDKDLFAEAYVRETGLSWPLLLDPERSLYQAYGMLRGSARAIYSPASIWLYLKLLAKGRRMRRTQSDVHQLGGDVLVDPLGVVRLHHVGTGPADRPSVAAILAAAR